MPRSPFCLYPLQSGILLSLAWKLDVSQLSLFDPQHGQLFTVWFPEKLLRNSDLSYHIPAHTSGRSLFLPQRSG